MRKTISCCFSCLTETISSTRRVLCILGAVHRSLVPRFAFGLGWKFALHHRAERRLQRRAPHYEVLETRFVPTMSHRRGRHLFGSCRFGTIAIHALCPSWYIKEAGTSEDVFAQITRVGACQEKYFVSSCLERRITRKWLPMDFPQFILFRTLILVSM